EPEPAPGRGRLGAPREPLEEVVAHTRVDPRAVVGDLEPDDAVLGRHRDADVRARRGVADGVVEQRPADLLDAILVAEAARRRRGRAGQDDPAAVPRTQAA